MAPNERNMVEFGGKKGNTLDMLVNFILYSILLGEEKLNLENTMFRT